MVPDCTSRISWKKLTWRNNKKKLMFFYTFRNRPDLLYRMPCHGHPPTKSVQYLCPCSSFFGPPVGPKISSPDWGIYKFSEFPRISMYTTWPGGANIIEQIIGVQRISYEIQWYIYIYIYDTEYIEEFPLDLLVNFPNCIHFEFYLAVFTSFFI